MNQMRRDVNSFLQYKIYLKWGTSLAVQWLELWLPLQGAWVQSLVGEVGSHMLCGSVKKKNYLSVREGLIAISEIGMKILGPHSRGD